MPRYRITRMLNERSAMKYDFDAADDEEAFRILHNETCLDTLLESSDDADVVDSDALDETRGLDRLDDSAFVMLVDEHCLKNQMPYSSPARDFAAKVAALGDEGAYTDAIETLDAVITEARALCGIGPSP
jgi:23S rRNA U2552 (ribose-2'-O)-methylase RlmE/FtsJ